MPGESLDRSPRKNWVENVGGLPSYIEKIANDIHDSGHTIEDAIKIAISRVKTWCATSTNADTKAKACAAVAEWEAKKAASHAKTAGKSVAKMSSLVQVGPRIMTAAELDEWLFDSPIPADAGITYRGDYHRPHILPTTYSIKQIRGHLTADHGMKLAKGHSRQKLEKLHAAAHKGKA